MGKRILMVIPKPIRPTMCELVKQMNKNFIVTGYL